MDERSAAINDVLVATCRSLLQYVGETWPWSSDEDQAAAEALTRLVEQQKGDVKQLVDLCLRRHIPVDFDHYTVDFTDLQYLSVHYLLGHLVENQERVVETVRRAEPRMAGDERAMSVMGRVLASEQSLLDSLKRLAAEAGAAAS